jgi:hypothetical protein
MVSSGHGTKNQAEQEEVNWDDFAHFANNKHKKEEDDRDRPKELFETICKTLAEKTTLVSCPMVVQFGNVIREIDKSKDKEDKILIAGIDRIDTVVQTVSRENCKVKFQESIWPTEEEENSMMKEEEEKEEEKKKKKKKSDSYQFTQKYQLAKSKRLMIQQLSEGTCFFAFVLKGVRKKEEGEKEAFALSSFFPNKKVDKYTRIFIGTFACKLRQS